MTDNKLVNLDKKQKLLLLLYEARKRGIDVSRVLPETAVSFNKEIDWGLDENGYFIAMDGSRYNPTANHRRFLESKARFILLYGSRGSGKSTAGAQKAMKKIMDGESGIVVNPDFENFKASTWPALKKWIPWKAVVPSHRRRRETSWEARTNFHIAFLNGQVLYCKGLRDPEQARGHNLNFLWYDEGGRDKTGKAWNLAIAGIRVGKNPQAWVTTTPKGKFHWLYEFFINRAIPEDLKLYLSEQGYTEEDLFDVIHITLHENKDNLDPMFYASLVTAYKDGWLLEQEINGEFVEEGHKVGSASWFTDKIIPPLDEDLIIQRVRFWDLAASEQALHKKDDPDETVGTLASKAEFGDKEIFLIEDQVAGRWSWADLKRIIVATAARDGHSVPIYIEQEPGAGGKNQIAELRNTIHEQLGKEWVVEGVLARDIGDRVAAAMPWFGMAQEGRVYLVSGAWNDGLLRQVDGFTLMLHDDRVTSVTGAAYVLGFVGGSRRKWANPSFYSVKLDWRV